MPFIRSAERLAETEDAALETIDRAALERDVASSDIDLRRAAVRRAGRMGAVDLLKGRLEAESDSGIRETIVTSLARIGSVEAARPLLDLLRSEDVPLRSSVIEALQSMGDVIIPEIERLLDDPDSDVRIFAVNIVVSLRSPRAPDIALRVLAQDAHVNVCAAAVDVLAELGQPEMAPALGAVAKRFPDHPFLAFAVRTALKRIG